MDRTPIRLGVNVDHVATLRRARGTSFPSPCAAAVLAELAGADQITIHLREDRRHIIDSDLAHIKNAIQVPLNLEMAATPEMLKIALELRPDRITLVPEKREELTTEGGLDVETHFEELCPLVASLKEAGLFVSLFVDPAPDQIRSAQKTSADAIEIHTGRYADETHPLRKKKEYLRIAQAATLARSCKLEAVAGHGLNYSNVSAIAKIWDITELNIGHSIVCRAVLVGLKEAIKEMKDLMIHSRTLAR